MVEPLSLSALIITLATLVLNVFQSLRSGHFTSKCFDCCEIEHNVELK